MDRHRACPCGKGPFHRPGPLRKAERIHVAHSSTECNLKVVLLILFHFLPAVRLVAGERLGVFEVLLYRLRVTRTVSGMQAYGIAFILIAGIELSEVDAVVIPSRLFDVNPVRVSLEPFEKVIFIVVLLLLGDKAVPEQKFSDLPIVS